MPGLGREKLGEIFVDIGHDASPPGARLSPEGYAPRS